MLSKKTTAFSFSTSEQNYNWEFSTPSSFDYAILKFYEYGNPDKDIYIRNISLIGGALWQRVTQLQLSVDGMQSEVSKKVGNNEIISKINQSAEAVGIKANKINLSANDILNLIAGNAINLTSKNITITSNAFKVDKNGKVTCSNIDITGGNINLTDDKELSVLTIGNQDGKETQLYSWGLFADNGLCQIKGGDSWISDENNNTLLHLTKTTSRIENSYSRIVLQDNGIFAVGNALYINGYKVLTNTSDKELKKNINNSKINAIETIKKIQHKQFDWKESGEHQSIGYIAQELEKINTDYVHKDPKYDDNGNIIGYYYQINILPLLATTTKAIQEQQENIENLKQRIEKLEAREEENNV